MKWSPEGRALYSTFLGGQGSAAANTVALDATGNIYLAGVAYDGLLSLRNAFQSSITGSGSHSFVMKLDPAGRQMLYSTYLGGSGMSNLRGIVVDETGAVDVSGTATSADFPVKNPLQPFRGGGQFNYDCFLAKLSPIGTSMPFGTFLGGSAAEGCTPPVLDGKGGVYIASSTGSSDFPVRRAYQREYHGGTDMFVARIADVAPIQPSPLIASPGRLTFRYVHGQSGSLQ